MLIFKRMLSVIWLLAALVGLMLLVIENREIIISEFRPNNWLILTSVEAMALVLMVLTAIEMVSIRQRKAISAITATAISIYSALFLIFGGGAVGGVLIQVIYALFLSVATLLVLMDTKITRVRRAG